MVATLFPLQYLVATLALWLYRHQQEVIDYLKEENRVLKAKLGDRKLQFTDAERGRLAIRAKSVGRKVVLSKNLHFITNAKRRAVLFEHLAKAQVKSSPSDPA